jgi:hypothetical protein
MTPRPSDSAKPDVFPLAAGLAPVCGDNNGRQKDINQAGASSSLHQSAYGTEASGSQISRHGLISEGFHAAINGVASAFGASDGQAQTSLAWDAADTLASFAKSVPLFMGPGKGTCMAAVLHGVDEIHLGDSSTNQGADFLLGVAKGASTKFVMDRFGAAEMSLYKKGAIIGGASSFVDSVLSRHTWFDEKGHIDPVSGMFNVTGQTLLGTAVGAVSFPIASSFGSKLTPKVQQLIGRRFNPALIESLTNGASFGMTSGFVGETAHELTSGEGFNPLTIAKRTLLEGVSTMAASGTGFRLAGGRFTLHENPVTEAVLVRAPAPEVADMNWLGETAANFNAKEYLRAYRDASRVDFPLNRPSVHTQRDLKLDAADLRAPNTVIKHVRTMMELGLADGSIMEVREPRTMIQLSGGGQIDAMNPPRVPPPRPAEVPSEVQRLMYREVPSGVGDGSKVWVNIFDSARTIPTDTQPSRPVADADLKLHPEIALARMVQRAHVLLMAEEMYHFRQFKNGGMPLSPEYLDYVRSRGTELAEGGSYDAREEEIVFAFSKAGFDHESINRFVVPNYARLRPPLMDYIRAQKK